ncbi:transcriptional regulator, LysR family protein [Rubellimicrobium mesophilum DSM 19309]|uniref:Transcriptional regulator, LysR family protein n=1 Tax=Rubellimicrobium mesophilum DSM 19309 TaxID=442562 RepID=A0A017HV75_9RHOB|nr:transcriptional regulator, LysR family protein [Rubellimicrobium mesophilum DSM 19309]
MATFDLNLLRVLDALLREGSTTAAGRRVGLSQPAVSAALARLRDALGDPLFVRRGPRLEATDYARSLAVPLREHLDSLQRLLSGPEAFDPATASVSFRIAGSDFFGEMLMPELGRTLLAEAPEVRVHLLDLVPTNYADTLDRYLADLALIPRQDAPDWIEWEPLFHSSFCMIARRGHPRLAGVEPGTPVPLDLFCELDHALMSPEGRTRAMMDDALERVGRARRVAMTLPFFGGICRSVATTDIVAMIPGQLARHMAPILRLEVYKAPLPLPAPLIGLVWHRRATTSPSHRWLREQVARILRPLNEGEANLPG